MAHNSGRVLSMAGAAVISAAALQCSGKLSVGEVSPSPNGETGSTGATGSFGSGLGTTGTVYSGSTGSSGYFDAGVPDPSVEYDSGPYDSGPSIVLDSTTPEPPGLACWENQLPAEAQPILPTATVSASCMAASTITQWRQYASDAGTMDTSDGRAGIVGRWVACSAGDTTFSSSPSAGIEFGGNGRWRLLVMDSGALVPATAADGGYIGGINDGGLPDYAGTQGRYYALATGQLDWYDDGSPGFYKIDDLELSADGNTLLIASTSGIPTVSYYARTSPAANDGDDNVPTTADGTCSMVGTWDLAMTSQSPAGTFSFDELGNFVGGALGADLCSSHTMYGKYQLASGLFQITESIGMGGCSWWYDAGYLATFDATCTHLTLQPDWDNCTGARAYFNGTTMLTKQ